MTSDSQLKTADCGPLVRSKIIKRFSKGRPWQMSDTYNGINIRSLLSKNLKRLRSLAKLSQVNLAAEADLTHNFINDIESGKKWVSAETLAKLSIALKAEPYQFFISELKWNERGAEIFSLYLDDFENSFEKMVDEYRYRFLADGGEDKSRQKSQDEPKGS